MPSTTLLAIAFLLVVFATFICLGASDRILWSLFVASMSLAALGRIDAPHYFLFSLALLYIMCMLDQARSTF